MFHLSHRLTKKVPENCLLIVLGIVVGVLLYVTHLEEEKRIYILNSDTFFLFLLPPIVLETGYFLPKRAFFDNIGTILLLAVLNKLFNTMCIGLTIWAFGKTILYGGTTFTLLECLLLASFITAVDPIAVLATFVEIRVNDTLYIVVFGESLLNDAVSIVSAHTCVPHIGHQRPDWAVSLIQGALSYVRKFYHHWPTEFSAAGFLSGLHLVLRGDHRWNHYWHNLWIHGGLHDQIHRENTRARTSGGFHVCLHRLHHCRSNRIIRNPGVSYFLRDGDPRTLSSVGSPSAEWYDWAHDDGGEDRSYSRWWNSTSNTISRRSPWRRLNMFWRWPRVLWKRSSSCSWGWRQSQSNKHGTRASSLSLWSLASSIERSVSQLRQSYGHERNILLMCTIRSGAVCQHRQPSSSSRADAYRYVNHVLRRTSRSARLRPGIDLEWKHHAAKKRVHHCGHRRCHVHCFHSSKSHPSKWGHHPFTRLRSLQGTTLGPLVKLLNVRRKQIEEPTMSATLTNRVRPKRLCSLSVDILRVLV